ncbi:MAG: hypothetical protein AB7P40_16185 [Chloroflexota bacterium]
MEDDAGAELLDETLADATDMDEDVLAARPKGGGSITDGTSNT